MPRGKYKRKKKCNEKAMITRLICISLKTDDHIYNKKLVSASEAEAYLQEIATLKSRCLPTNVRALQVIEKLTRFMNMILTEQNISDSSSHNQSFQMTTQFTASASPVYSLPDEDRTLNISLQNDEDLNITNITDDNVTLNEINIYNEHIINTKKPQDNITHSQNNKVIDVIDMTNDSDREECVEIGAVNDEEYTSIEHVNTGISTMTLQDQVVSQNVSDNYSCSQSILDNYNSDITEAVKENDRTEVEIVLHDKINAKPRNTQFIAMTSKATVIPSESMVGQATNVGLNVDSKPGNQRCNIPEKNETEKKVPNKKYNKLKRPRTKKNTEPKVNKAGKICFENGPNTTNSKHINKINYNGKENNPKIVKKPKKAKKVPEIYNENVENDLSWVENIRFVREISPSEYDPALALLQDNFWDNFQLPGTWDDLDFNV